MSVYKQLKYFRLPRLSNFRRVQARRRDRRLHHTASLKQRTSVSLSLPARSHPSARKIGAVTRSVGGVFTSLRRLETGVRANIVTRNTFARIDPHSGSQECLKKKKWIQRDAVWKLCEVAREFYASQKRNLQYFARRSFTYKYRRRQFFLLR